MRHSVQLQGFGVRLRPVQTEDAGFIVWLRNLDHVRGKIGDSAADIPTQRAWLEEYYERAGDYYFIVETLQGVPVGTHSLYDLQGGSAELGRWVIRPGVQAAVPSHMVAFSIAFDVLRLQALRNATVATNISVLSISRRFGFEETSFEPGGRLIGGKPVDMVHFILTAEKWVRTRPRLVPVAETAATLVREWELAQLATAAQTVSLGNQPGKRQSIGC